MASSQRLVLASGSPRRLALLQQAGIEPDRLMPADIDETPQRSEHPRSLAKRLSKGKAEVAARRLRELDYGPATILAADTVVSVGRQIMPKAEIADDALANLRTLSGRTHRVYTGICVIGPNGALRQRLIETRVRFKRLSRQDIQSYIASDEWRGKAGGYAIQGLAGSFVVRLIGSYTSVVGLPLAETLALLAGEGYDIHATWRAPRMVLEDDAAADWPERDPPDADDADDAAPASPEDADARGEDQAPATDRDRPAAPREGSRESAEVAVLRALEPAALAPTPQDPGPQDPGQKDRTRQDLGSQAHTPQEPASRHPAAPAPDGQAGPAATAPASGEGERRVRMPVAVGKDDGESPSSGPAQAPGEERPARSERPE